MRQRKGGFHFLKGFSASGRLSSSQAWIRSSTMPAVVFPDLFPPRKALIGSWLLKEDRLLGVGVEVRERVALSDLRELGGELERPLVLLGVGLLEAP
jgi:hypothetical protein